MMQGRQAPPRHDGPHPPVEWCGGGRCCESWFGGIGWSDGRCFPKTSINECCLLLNLIRFHAYGNTEIIEICMCFAGVLGEGMLKSKK